MTSMMQNNLIQNLAVTHMVKEFPVFMDGNCSIPHSQTVVIKSQVKPS
jgi:hypothetical protein